MKFSVDIQKRLLLKFSLCDISISFNKLLYEGHKTWYRQGNLVDLSCEQSLKILENVSVIYYTLDMLIFNVELKTFNKKMYTYL